ncbi:hypothetical protein ACHWQZ_G018751 [Mnemiopsis leidyi]
MLFDEQNNICSDPKQIANILKGQFWSVFSNPEETDLTAAEFTPLTISKRFSESDLTFSEEDVISAIDEIKPDAAPDPDGIPTILLNSCKHPLARPILTRSH